MLFIFVLHKLFTFILHMLFIFVLHMQIGFFLHKDRLSLKLKIPPQKIVSSWNKKTITEFKANKHYWFSQTNDYSV